MIRGVNRIETELVSCHDTRGVFDKVLNITSHHILFWKKKRFGSLLHGQV